MTRNNDTIARLVSIMENKGKATLTKEEREILSGLDKDTQKAYLQEATRAFKERKQVAKLNQFLADHLCIRIPNTTAMVDVRPVVYNTYQGSLLALDGLNVPAMALIGVDKSGHLSCKLIAKGRAVSNQLSIAYGRRELKEWITDRVRKGLTQAINDMLYSMDYAQILKAILANGKASSFKDARHVTEDMAKFAGWNMDDIKAEAKKLRTCKVTKKEERTA